MGTFVVTVEETVTGTFSIEAESPEEAADTAQQRYRAGILVLEPGEVQDVRLCVLGPGNQLSNWERL